MQLRLRECQSRGAGVTANIPGSQPGDYGCDSRAPYSRPSPPNALADEHRSLKPRKRAHYPTEALRQRRRFASARSVQARTFRARAGASTHRHKATSRPARPRVGSRSFKPWIGAQFSGGLSVAPPNALVDEQRSFKPWKRARYPTGVLNQSLKVPWRNKETRPPQERVSLGTVQVQLLPEPFDSEPRLRFLAHGRPRETGPALRSPKAPAAETTVNRHITFAMSQNGEAGSRGGIQKTHRVQNAAPPGRGSASLPGTTSTRNHFAISCSVQVRAGPRRNPMARLVQQENASPTTR